MLGWLRDSRSVYGRSLPLRGRLDRSRLRPASMQPSLHQTRNLQGRQVPVSPGLERRTLHHWSASPCICVCTCECVWCLSAYQLRGCAEWDFCDNYFVLHSGNLDMRKVEHRGFAKEGWKEGLEGSAYAWGSSYPLSLWSQKHTKEPLPKPLGITPGLMAISLGVKQ